MGQLIARSSELKNLVGMGKLLLSPWFNPNCGPAYYNHHDLTTPMAQLIPKSTQLKNLVRMGELLLSL